MNAIAIGIIYGVVWYSVNAFVSRYVASKYQNKIFIGVAPLLVSVPILLSVILFKPSVGNWQSFVQIWGISFLAGALVIKFMIFNRFYK